ncbi:amino acid transporter [Rhodoferax lacus]|uniref:Amino acid transporter n=1 Tax=Rhodoferax lacus TaxID=2184758 RepID=A0A3E1RED0_9BURK|nr:LysE/ArgO family amino acid transporter [Rhodoferax lacus]RFO97719.1 amino acid transporter [Rhodoferax lacus]
MDISLAGTSFFTGLSLMLSLIVAIGAQNTFVLRQGLRREHVLAVVLACAVLDALLMVLGVSGLAASLGDSPRLLNGLGLVGAVVLAVYGVLALRRAIAPQVLLAHTDGLPAPRGRVVMQVLSLSLLNPHVYLDTVVLVGAVGARQPAGLQGAFLLGSCLASLLWFAALGFGARLLTPLFARPAAWRVLDLLVAAMMWAVAWPLARQGLTLF